MLMKIYVDDSNELAQLRLWTLQRGLGRSHERYAASTVLLADHLELESNKL